ncbi:MAG: S-methyl-5-thioribose-1-phosphate isomerase [Acidobacteria bacterium]|nr:S-methyl-5-thioribose-1-phosphate isomerase [Acidobacteriota bacterium]
MSSKIRTLDWDNGTLLLLDQRQLPLRTAWVRCATAKEVAGAIGTLVVRGAPAIGVAAAYGMALAALEDPAGHALRDAANHLKLARPTAVNLAWAVDRVLAAAMSGLPETRAARALAEARTIEDEDAAACLRMARLGADLLPGAAPVELMTHCNAGALATAGIGTALGVIREVAGRGRLRRLWAPEARPVLQGARLTAWEAMQDGLPITLMADTAAASVLRAGRVAAVFVGADRIAADGAVANKVGTYPLAVVAARHGVPFYVVAPVSTVDLETPSGDAIPIEERDGDEVRRVRGMAVAPPGVDVFNPAFDVTPPGLVTAIVTDRGVARPPYGDALATLIPA